MAKTDWDVVLQDLYSRPPHKETTDDGAGCLCPKCNPRQAVIPDWKARFSTATWDAFRAMRRLGFRFNPDPPPSMANDDGSDGVSGGGMIWLRANARYPIRTAAHEMAHVLLGHQGLPNGARTANELVAAEEQGHEMSQADRRDLLRYLLNEVEAESVAALVSYTLGYPDGSKTRDVSRQYIWGYMPLDMLADMFKVEGGVPPKVRERIKDAAGTILTAGYTAVAKAA